MNKTFRVLFWNLHGNTRALEFAIDLCRSRGVDLLVAAELPKHAPDMTRSPVARLGYTSFRAELEIQEIAAYGHAVALCVRLSPTSRDITVVGVHLRSRLYQHHEEDQRLAADTCHGFVEDLEQVSHDRTIVIGDFNLDPYSPAMVGIGGLNAMMTPPPHAPPGRRTKPRHVLQSPGTYYLGGPGALGYFWHMLDQVLIRPSLAPHFEAVDVLADDALVTRNIRRPSPAVSDHLPIELTLNARVFDSKDTQ